MRIVIVMLYNSINSGSYLQAYSLKTYLESLGYDVFFFKNKARKPFLDLFFVILKSIVLFKFKNANFAYKKYRKFKKNQKVFKITSRINREDIVIYGSDEIWNIKRDNIKKYEYFFGNPAYNSLSFSPSINRSTKDDFANYPQLVENLKSIKFVSVRDYHSKKELEPLLSKNIQVTTDPTMLINFKKEGVSKNVNNIIKEKYILLYSYPNHFKNIQIESLRSFAENNNLKIVSSNHLFDWCDESIPTSPFELLELFKNAEYVVTDTFHGTVFSLLFKKKFVTYASDNIKIHELVKQFGCECTIIKTNSDFKELIKNQLDYEQISGKIKEKSHASQKFLKESLGALLNEKNII